MHICSEHCRGDTGAQPFPEISADPRHRWRLRLKAGERFGCAADGRLEFVRIDEKGEGGGGREGIGI